MNSEVLIVTDLRLELFLTESALVFAIQVYLSMFHQVTRSLKLFITCSTHEVSPIRILMDGNLVFPHVSASDGGVAAVGAQVRLGVVSVGVEMVGEMTPGLESLGTILIITNKQPGAASVTVDVVLVFRVRFRLET